MALWTPADEGDALELLQWVDASDTDARTISAGLFVGLQDKSGNGRDYNQGSGTRQPQLNAGAQNGLDVAEFDGVNDTMVEITGWRPANLAASNLLVFVVARHDGSASQGIIGDRSQSQPDGWSFRKSSSTSLFYYHTGYTGNPARTVDPSGFSIFEFERGGLTARVGDNGNFGTFSNISGYATATADLYIGSENNGTASYFDGAIAEIIIMESASETIRQKIEGYLAHKWGIQARLDPEHPYFDAPPQVADPGAYGEITATVNIAGIPAQRQLIAISYEPQVFAGEETPRRIVVGETVSAADGTYTMQTPGFLDEVIVLVLDDYGEVWRPNRSYTVGQRIRPTFGNETGYGYDITIGGNSGPNEPSWWIPAGGTDTGSIGDATAVANPLWWSVAHAPILPTPSEAPAVLWTPGNTTVDLWIDWSDAEKYTVVADAYSSVIDGSGNDRNATQTSSASRPARIAGGQNGRDFARFDGGDDIMQLVEFAQASGQHLFFFGDTTALQTGYRACLDRSAGSSDNLSALFGASGQAYRPSIFWAGNQRAVQPSPVQRKCGIRWHFTVGSPSMALTQVDADTPVTETFTASVLSNWATIGGPGALPAADKYEIVMLPASATTDDIDRVWGYGMHRWGLDSALPSGFIYKDSPPVVE